MEGDRAPRQLGPHMTRRCVGINAAPLTVAIAKLVIVAALLVVFRGAAGGEGPQGGEPSSRGAGPAGGTGTARVAHYRVGEGSRIDLGWTGLAHDQEWPADQRLELALDCGGD